MPFRTTARCPLPTFCERRGFSSATLSIYLLYPCDKGAKRMLCAFSNLFRKEDAPAEVSGASGQPEFTPVTTVVDRSLRRVQDVDGAIVEKAV